MPCRGAALCPGKGIENISVSCVHDYVVENIIRTRRSVPIGHACRRNRIQTDIVVDEAWAVADIVFQHIPVIRTRCDLSITLRKKSVQVVMDVRETANEPVGSTVYVI